MSVIVLVNGYILNTLRFRFVYVIAEHRFQLDTSYWSSQPMSLRCAAARLRFYTLTGSTLQQSCRKNSTRLLQDTFRVWLLLTLLSWISDSSRLLRLLSAFCCSALKRFRSNSSWEYFVETKGSSVFFWM